MENPAPDNSNSRDSALTEQTLSGRVEKIIFNNGENGFQVLSIQDPEGHLHCVCGMMPGVAEGQGVELRGKWEVHKEHGRRFRVSNYSLTLPTTVEGIEKYLASGIIKGVGEKYARAIVRTFGAETLRILDTASTRLKEVPGLGKKRIGAIRKFWSESSDKRTLQLHMQSLGITNAYFNRIYGLYGNRSAEVLRENPYQLASEVDGIGFIMADRIAANSGIVKTAPQRLVSGVTYALSQIRLAGHVCMPRPEFVRTLGELLDVDEAHAERALEMAVQIGKAVIQPGPDRTEMIYEPGLLRCEQEMPLLLANLFFRERHYGEWILRHAAPPDSKFSAEQIAAVERAGKNAGSIVTIQFVTDPNQRNAHRLRG